MKPQPLLHLHPVEKWERQMVNDPPLPSPTWREVVLGALLLIGLIGMSVGIVAFFGYLAWRGS